MQRGQGENRAVLRGEAAAAPVFSHENHGVTYEIFPLSVRRLSGCPDVVNVVAPSALLRSCPLAAGDEVEVEGEVRSYNNRSGAGSRLVITILARRIMPGGGPHANTLCLSGALCRTPVLRRTPLGREICDLMLAVNRRCGRADYLPCIAWGALARRCAGMAVGDALSLEGRLQSRGYTKVVDGECQARTAYEISIIRLTGADEGDI